MRDSSVILRTDKPQFRIGHIRKKRDPPVCFFVFLFFVVCCLFFCFLLFVVCFFVFLFFVFFWLLASAFRVWQSPFLRSPWNLPRGEKRFVCDAIFNFPITSQGPDPIPDLTIFQIQIKPSARLRVEIHVLWVRKLRPLGSPCVR